MIPTRSINPTAYLPKFSPLWTPDKALNPTTSALSFHLLSFTSIQCAVIPRNPVFVVSADHPSMVIDTFPGAAFSGAYKTHIHTYETMDCLPLSPHSAVQCVSRIDYADTPSNRTNSEGRPWLILVSLRQEHCEMRDYQQV